MKIIKIIIYQIEKLNLIIILKNKEKKKQKINIEKNSKILHPSKNNLIIKFLLMQLIIKLNNVIKEMNFLKAMIYQMILELMKNFQQKVYGMHTNINFVIVAREKN